MQFMSMAAGLIEYNYNDRVFINCPFDELYHPLFVAAIFTIYHCGFCPTSSLTEENGLENRIDKISRIIGECRFGIHDISRIELNSSGYPRFNMPFEFGLFYGAHRFGNSDQRSKNALILEKKQYSYQLYLSDINGIDTRAHGNEPFWLIHHIRNWLSINSGRKVISGTNAIWTNYLGFLLDLPKILEGYGFQNCNQVPFSEFCDIVALWLGEISS
jgi:hypothetical protein